MNATILIIRTLLASHISSTTSSKSERSRVRRGGGFLRVSRSYDYAARKKNTLIIPAAGMDSVPLDYAVYLSIRAGKRAFGPKTTFGASRTGKFAQEDRDHICTNQTHIGIWMPGSASGGTLATILGIMESTTMAKMKTVLKPYALSPSTRFGGLPAKQS